MLVLDQGRKSKVEHLTFTPDGSALVASGETGVFVWRTFANGQKAQHLSSERWLGPTQFTADGRWLFVASDHRLHCINPLTGRHTTNPLWGGEAAWFEVSPVAPVVLVSQILSVSLSRAACWDVNDLSPAGKLWEKTFPAMIAPRWRFTADGSRLVHLESGWVQGRNRQEPHVVLSDPATGDPLGPSDPQKHVGAHPTLSPGGRWLATRETNWVELFPVAGGPAARVRNDNKKFFTDFAFHPGGRFLAATSNDATVKLYDTGSATWELARTFTWNAGKMRSVAFSPDGLTCAAGSDKGQVVLWDVDL